MKSEGYLHTNCLVELENKASANAVRSLAPSDLTPIRVRQHLALQSQSMYTAKAFYFHASLELGPTIFRLVPPVRFLIRLVKVIVGAGPVLAAD